MNPQSVVDLYHHNGYHILSITDHDRASYPWEAFSDMEPSNLSVTLMEYGLSGKEPESSRYRPRNIHLLNDDLVFESRDPAELGMIPIKGNEISGGQHHMGSYFNRIFLLGRLIVIFPKTLIPCGRILKIFYHLIYLRQFCPWIYIFNSFLKIALFKLI